MRRIVALAALTVASLCVDAAFAAQPSCASCQSKTGCATCGTGCSAHSLGALHARIKDKLHSIPFILIAIPQHGPGGHPEDWVNCECEGSYRHPVPPLYTYHWPGSYAQTAMTDYHSPWRFPPLKPYYDEPSPGEAGTRMIDDYYAEPPVDSEDVHEPVYRPQAHRVPLPADQFRR